MIGYLKPFLKELPQELKKEYRAVHCGLCHTLKRAGGLVGTMCLNYEATLFLVLLLALREDEPRVFHGCCSLTPLLRVPFVDYLSPAFIQAACVSLVAADLEVKDNLQDEKALRWIVAERLLRRRARRAQATLDGAFDAVQVCVCGYYALEQEPAPDFDALLDASGRLMEAMAAPLLCAADLPNEPELLVLANALGRWIYLMDACDDWLEDQKRGEFNPVNRVCEIALLRDVVGAAEAQMEICVSQLPLRRYQRLIDTLLIDNPKTVSRRVLEKFERTWQNYERQI